MGQAPRRIGSPERLPVCGFAPRDFLSQGSSPHGRRSEADGVMTTLLLWTRNWGQPRQMPTSKARTPIAVVRLRNALRAFANRIVPSQTRSSFTQNQKERRPVPETRRRWCLSLASHQGEVQSSPNIGSEASRDVPSAYRTRKQADRKPACSDSCDITRRGSARAAPNAEGRKGGRRAQVA